MRGELRDSLEFLYADAGVGAKAARELRVDVGRGGTASAHLLLAGLQAGAPVRATLRRAGAAVRGARWFRLVDVPVEANTGPDGFQERDGRRNRFVARRAPFRVYDAMEPIGTGLRAPAPSAALRLQIPVPRDARPGRREYAIAIACGREVLEFALTVVVHRAVIPPAGRGSLPYTNWFSCANMATRHGVEPWSEGHWRMIRRYAELMARGRQNAFLIPLPDVFAVRDGAPVLDRARLRRIVAIFTAAGLHLIEGGHVGGRSGGEWLATTFETTVVRAPATSVAGNAVLRHLGRQLMAEIERNGWRDRWIQHAVDEPCAENAVDYRILVGMVRKHFPGLPIMDATMDPGLAGSVDIWCPKAEEYQAHRGEFEANRRLGDRIWFYTCCTPGGRYLNRLLDMELLRPALFGWAAARYRLDGFLHWGLNQNRPDHDPFASNVVPFPGGHSLPAGDTHVIYPGADGPWSSVRFEAHREGFEDYELLKRLAARRPRRAEAIIRTVLRSFSDYGTDVAAFRKARRDLLEAESGPAAR